MFPPKHFCFPVFFFFPQMTFYSQEILQKCGWQNVLPKRICSSKTCSPKFPPKKIPFKKFVPHFAPLIFIQKNLLPKFFLPRICCRTFLLSIFLLTIKFYLQKFLQNILLAKFPPHKNLSSKTWSLKFTPKKISFKKKFFPILPPPPQKKKFIQKNLLPKYFLPRICCQTFLLSIFLLTVKFYFPKFLQNIFAGEISPSQESLLQNLVPKISSHENFL